MGMSVRQHGIWTSPWSHFKKTAKHCSNAWHHPPSHFHFFPLPRKIWSEFIGVCIMRRLRWAERGRVIPRTEGQAFWGSWLSTPALWCMHSCVPATTPLNPRFFLGIGCIKLIQSDCINIRCYLHDFSNQKPEMKLKWMMYELRTSTHYLEQHGQGLKKG